MNVVGASFKRAVRRAARPVVHPLIEPFFRRVEGRVGPVDHRLAEAEARISALAGDAIVEEGPVDRITRMERELAALRPAAAIADHLPALLNAISTQNATARLLRRELDELQARVAALAAGAPSADPAALAASERRAEDAARQLERLEQRIEHVRLDLLARTREGQAGTGDDAMVDAAALPRPLRLNLGAGERPLAGYVNVDACSLPGIDLVADARALPLPPASVAEIRSSHLVDAFSEDELRHVVLPHWRALLEPGGAVVLVVPDADAMRQADADDCDADGCAHRPELLEEAVADAGFADAEWRARGRRNGATLEMELVAHAPDAVAVGGGGQPSLHRAS